MNKTQHLYNKNSWLIPASVIFIILVGIIISIIQIRQKNTIRTQAQLNSSTNDIVNCQVTTDDISISSEEQKLLDELNSYRTQLGLGQITWSEDLIRSATWMSNDMLTHNYLEHADSLGRPFYTRLENCGYSEYKGISENIGSGTRDGPSTFQMWKNSPPHNTNMINPDYNQAGIALASNPTTNSYYWTLDLGSSSTANHPTFTPTSMPSYPTSEIASPIPATPTPSPRPTSPITPTATPWPANISTPTPVPGFVPKADNTQVYVSIKMIGIGIGGNTRPKHLSRYAQIEVFDLTNKSIALGSGNLTYDGRDLFQGLINLGKINNGTYYIKVIGNNTLVRLIKPQFVTLNNTNLNVLPPATLIQGDVNTDNMIDINDYNSVLPCFQNTKCVYRELIDLNDDGITNAIDYNILLFNLWESRGD